MLEPDAPLFIVLNSSSGSGDAELAQTEIRAELELAQREHEFFVATRGAEVGALVQRAAERARERKGALIAAGGDGTINAAASAILKTGRPLGIIPQGTFNYTTRAHAIPADTRAATRALLAGRVRAVQVGLVNDCVFLVNAGVGMHPELLEEREAYKAKLGRSRAVALWAGLRTLLREHRQLALQIEHDQQREVVRTPALFVGNNALQLAEVGLDQAEHDVENRYLAALVVKPVSNLALLGMALRGALGTLGGAEYLREFPFRSMTVAPQGWRAARRVKVALDGEVRWLQAPLRFSIAPERLQLLIPLKPKESA